MQAIKLHKRKQPFLGKGSYLVPITTWRVAMRQIRNWLPVLAEKTQGWDDDRHYITLVKIPDDHPVILEPDWSGGGNRSPLPVREISKEIKDKIAAWLDDSSAHGFVGPKASLPQVILGARLPKSCVKWTKDRRLLYRGNTRHLK